MQMKLDFSTPKKQPKLRVTEELEEEDKENTDVTMTPPPKRLRAKRCLFGAPDPGRVRDLLQKELDSILKTSLDKYDFDFHADKPTAGDNDAFEWSTISVSDVPKVYLDKRPNQKWHVTSCGTPPTPRKPRVSPRRLEYEQTKIDSFVATRRRSTQLLRKKISRDFSPNPSPIKRKRESIA